MIPVTMAGEELPPMNKWFVYIIRCSNNTLYTGITTDVDRRIQEHQGKDGKGAKYLKGKGPLILAWKTAVADRSHASKLEYNIKQLSKSDKERLVIGDTSLLAGLT